MGDGSILLVLGAIVTAVVVLALWREGDDLSREWEAASDTAATSSGTSRPRTPRASLRPTPRRDEPSQPEPQ